MKSLIVLRGLPGSGKSKLAEVLSEKGKYPCFSIDDYFTSEDGTYNFVHTENHKAYQACQDQVESAMVLGSEKIFLHNVFSMDWEMEPYFRMAAELGYQVFVVTVENRHKGKNLHGIQDDQLRKMAEKFKVVLYSL